MNISLIKLTTLTLVFATLSLTAAHTSEQPKEDASQTTKDSSSKPWNINYLGYAEPFAIYFLTHVVVKSFKKNHKKSHPAHSYLEPIHEWSEGIELAAFLLLSQAKRDFKKAKTLWQTIEALGGLSLVTLAAVATYYNVKAADHAAHVQPRKTIDQAIPTIGLTALASGVVLYQSWKLLKKAFPGISFSEAKQGKDAQHATHSAQAA